MIEKETRCRWREEEKQVRQVNWKITWLFIIYIYELQDGLHDESI
jgi:hypothetical protein